MKFFPVILLAAMASAAAVDPAALLADRTAVERVYYNHRLGEKPAFEQVLPRDLLEKLVSTDLKKEFLLKQVYGVEVGGAEVQAEVQRIDSTTRAPDVLTELKVALGGDPTRFARIVARPIVVERELRRRFENDDTLHAIGRQEVTKARDELLAAKMAGAGVDRLMVLLKAGRSNEVVDTMWQLSSRPAEKSADSVDLAEIQKRFGPQAQLLTPPGGTGKESLLYFEDLPGELQNVLRVQLRRAGDVSAVIETPTTFLLYLVRERTAERLAVTGFSRPKRSYDQWIEEQPARGR